MHGNPSIRSVLLGLKNQNMQYSFGTCEVTVVLEDEVLSDLFQELQTKLTYFFFPALGTSFLSDSIWTGCRRVYYP